MELTCKDCGVTAPNVDKVRPKGGGYTNLCPKCLDRWFRMSTNEKIVLGGLKDEVS